MMKEAPPRFGQYILDYTAQHTKDGRLHTRHENFRFHQNHITLYKTDATVSYIGLISTPTELEMETCTPFLGTYAS